MVAVVLNAPNRNGKTYRLANEKDLEVFKKAEAYLMEKREKLKEEWGIDPVPDEEMNQDDPTTVAGRGYGFKVWGDLFNSRQKLALITFTEKVRLSYKKMIEEGYKEDYARAVVSYLGLGVDRLAIYATTLGYWHNTRELVNPGMGRQALAMTWDYSEVNVFGGNADWQSAMNWIISVLSHLYQIPPVEVEE
jgi:adenine-specific DNA methylase